MRLNIIADKDSPLPGVLEIVSDEDAEKVFLRLFAECKRPLRLYLAGWKPDIEDFYIQISHVPEGEKTAAEEESATVQALDDICKLLKTPEWDYPGQVVRDVAKALGMSIEEMSERLKEEE